MRKRTLPQLPGYEIDYCIGRGAGATISLAVEKAAARQVAVKHVIAHAPRDERFIEQAENEFAVATKLNHPALRKCFDIVRVRKWLKVREVFLIMEYVEGDRLEDQCPESLDSIASIFIDVAEGLHSMHLAGFVHADIKPNNILLLRGGGVKVIDFGQSCPIGHQKERVQGTPDYMAPEQIHRRPIDQRTDVFNLGATMYWVMTGKFFRTQISTAPAASKKIEIESRRGNSPPHDLNPRVPVPLSRLIMDCCESDREQRPRDMRDVIARLETVRHVLSRRPEGRRSAVGEGH